MKKVTIASYTPFLKDIDDAILKKYLNHFGMNVDIVSWDNKEYNWMETDLVIIRSTWDYYQRFDEYVDWLKYLKDKNVKVLNNVDIILNNIFKEKQIRWIKENNLPIIATCVFSKYDETCLKPEPTLLETLEKHFKDYVGKSMFVLKLSVSAYTEKVYLVDPYNVNKDPDCIITDDYENAFQTFSNKGENKKLIIQVYSEGIKNGEYGLVFLNQKYSFSVIKKPGRIYGKESMVPVEKKDIPHSIYKYANKIAKMYPLDKVLYCRVDMIIEKGEPLLMEIELAEPDLYIRLGDNFDINVTNPDYYMPLVQERGCKCKTLLNLAKNIIERVDNTNYTYVEDLESAKYYDALPRFSKEVYDYLEKLGIKNKNVVDLGCGTGRLTIDLLERGNMVYAVDPDANMRKMCENKCSKYKNNLIIVNGTNTNLNIKDKSVHYIISSQSFHMFDTNKFKSEASRVLKDKDNVIIMWYRIDFNNPIYKEMLESIKRNYKDYETRYNTDEITGSKLEEDANNIDANNFFDGNSHMENIVSKSLLTKDEFLTLGLSLSIFPITHKLNSTTKVLKQKSFNKDQYISDLEEIFNKYSKNNKIELEFNVQIHSKN